MNNKLSLIVGVGYRNGVGGALCASLLQSGVNVIAVGRSQEKLDSLSQDLAQLDCKGKFFTLVSDVSNEEKIEEIFEAVDDKDMLCDLLVYNAAEPNIPKNFLEMKPEYLRKMWHTNWLTAALVSQQAISRMLPNNRGTLIYTGATASTRGNAGYSAFASSKSGLRTLSQSLAKEFGPKGIHVVHTIIDGIINGTRLAEYGDGIGQKLLNERGLDGSLSTDAIASAYLYLYNQEMSTWTHELDLRPFSEKF